jgi:hypothetical protein
MSNKEIFIREVKTGIENGDFNLSAEARDFFFKTYCPDPSTIKLSDAAKEILMTMKTDCNAEWTSKTIGEMLGKSGRSVSGSMRKLVEVGYVEKASESPVTYKMTEDGINFNID